MTTPRTKCADCDQVLMDDAPGAVRTPCPKCGSTKQNGFESLEDKVVAYDSIRGKMKRPLLRSDQKLRWDSFAGFDFCDDLSRMVRVERTIDKDADWYSERITDIQTGNVIHECNEKLSDHWEHGSAKKP